MCARQCRSKHNVPSLPVSSLPFHLLPSQVIHELFETEKRFADVMSLMLVHYMAEMPAYAKLFVHLKPLLSFSFRLQVEIGEKERVTEKLIEMDLVFVFGA